MSKGRVQVIVNLRLPENVAAFLSAEAKKSGLTKSRFLRLAIAQALEQRFAAPVIAAEYPPQPPYSAAWNLEATQTIEGRR